MERLLIIPILILLAAAGAFPQEDNSSKIKQIRDFYTSISSEIEKIEKSEDAAFQSELAVNELVINKLNKSWPAVGNYSVVYRFYYKRVGEEHYPDHLVKVSVRTESAARKYYKEYLFDDAKKLVFVFSKNEEGIERRAYFNNGELLEHIGEPEKLGGLVSPFVSASLEKAARLQTLFMISNN